MSDVTEETMTNETDDGAAAAAVPLEPLAAPGGDDGVVENDASEQDADDGATATTVLEPPAPDAPVLSVDDAAKLIEHGASVDEADAFAREARETSDAAPVTAPAWLETALEALVFAAPEPLTASRLREVLADEGHEFPLSLVKGTLQVLVEKWASPEKSVGGGMRLLETGAGFAFRTSPDSAQFLRRFFAAKPQRLSRAALETLAIIAYRQPVTRPQVDDIRGVDSAGALKNLLDRKLIRVLGKADDVGRPLIYGTTRTFLDFFSLSGLSDLPTLRDYQDLKGGAGVPEPLPTPDDGPVKVMDLFDPLGSGDLVSKETEEESAKALSALENALGQATHVTARALAFEKGDVALAEALPPPERYTIEDDDEDRAAHEASERHHAEGWPPDGSAEAVAVDEAVAHAEGSAAAPADALTDAPGDAADDGAHAGETDSDRDASPVDALAAPTDPEHTGAAEGAPEDAPPVVDDTHGSFRTRRSDEGSRFTPRTLLRDPEASDDGPGSNDDEE